MMPGSLTLVTLNGCSQPSSAALILKAKMEPKSLRRARAGPQ